MHCNSALEGLFGQPYLPVAEDPGSCCERSDSELDWAVGLLVEGSSRLALLGADPPEEIHQCGG